MNQKFLKKLRRVVRSMYAHLPARVLHLPVQWRMVDALQSGLNLDGTPKKVPMQFPTSAMNDQMTQRGAYRLAKKQARLG